MSQGRGAETVRKADKVLSGILADAVTDRLLAANPAAKVKLPKRPPSRNVYLTAEQLAALATECDRYGYKGLILLLGLGGARWGEAAALRVSDVNFLRHRVHLHENAVAVNGKTEVGTLKSGKDRTLFVPKAVTDAIAAACDGKGRDALIWSAKDGGHLNPPGGHSWLDYAVQRCRAADETFPRVTAHDLRHTAASLAVSSGANVKGVQKMLGHASASMTLDVYADLFDSDLEAVAQNVGKLWASVVNGG